MKRISSKVLSAIVNDGCRGKRIPFKKNTMTHYFIKLPRVCNKSFELKYRENAHHG